MFARDDQVDGCSSTVDFGLRNVLNDILNDDSGGIYMTELALIELSALTSVSVDGLVQTVIALHVEGL